MAIKYWLKSDNDLFLMSEEGPIYLLNIAIQKVEWVGSNTRARVIMSGLLPQSKELAALQDGSSFSVCNSTWGFKEGYHPDKVIATFECCKITKKWINDLVVDNPTDQNFLVVFVEMEADFKLLI